MIALSSLLLLALGAVECLAYRESAPTKGEHFPLVWICLAVSVVAVAIGTYVAWRRPQNPELPGRVMMTAYDGDLLAPAAERESSL